MKNWCIPIPTPAVEDKMELILNKTNPTYGTLFRYAIVTGQDYVDILNTKVSDVLGKDTLVIKNFSHVCKEYSVYLDYTTKLKLSELCVGKKEDDYVFCGRNPHKPLPRSSFQNALATTAASLELTNITPYSLRKTHFLHILRQYGIRQVMKLAGYKTEARAYEFLRLSPNIEETHTRDELIQDCALLTKEISLHLQYISSTTSNPYNTDRYLLELSSDLKDVEERLKKYNLRSK